MNHPLQFYILRKYFLAFMRDVILTEVSSQVGFLSNSQPAISPVPLGFLLNVGLFALVDRCVALNSLCIKWAEFEQK
jgi:hypothetical protein